MFLNLNIKKQEKSLSLREFYNRRNKVLVIRNRRGIGDILMCRMIFEDFHKIMPDINLIFACPKEYHNLTINHPYINQTIDSKNIKFSDYPVSYNISDCCIIEESIKGREIVKTRPEIWSNYCGVELTDHNMFVPFISQETINKANNIINKLNKHNLPKLLFCPKAFDKLRSLLQEQTEDIIQYLKSKDIFAYCTNNDNILDLGIPILSGYDTHTWLGFIHAANYVVTVDTATFHYAGAIKKPLTGIFTHVDGKIRGKYYDFILVQKHRDNGDWECNGPCYTYNSCNHSKCKNKDYFTPKPCITELTSEEIIEGIEKMFKRWNT